MFTQETEKEIQDAPRTISGWLAASAALNLLLLQVLVLVLETDPASFLDAYGPVFSAVWILLAVGASAALGQALTRVFHSSAENLGLGRYAMLLAACVIVLTASLNPGHQAAWLGGFQLSRYPLAGLELKALALVWLLLLGREPGREPSDQALHPQSRAWTRRFSKWREVGLAGALALALILLPMVPPELHLPLGRVSAVPSGTWVSSQALLPSDGYELPIRYGDIGPRLVSAGAIDVPSFARHFEDSGEPLTQGQLSILTEGSDSLIRIDEGNARFLLDLLWAFGLTNRNDLLTGGPMMETADGDIGRYASTGGWSLGSMPGPDLYASAAIVPLTPEQQSRVEEVAAHLFRPCCNNPTSFPDCNHGMAMLGLLELMSSQGMNEQEMWQAAKYVNAYWFVSQMGEVAKAFEAVKGQSFVQIPAEEALGPAMFSAAGFRNVHAWLQTNGFLDSVPGAGASCGA